MLRVGVFSGVQRAAGERLDRTHQPTFKMKESRYIALITHPIASMYGVFTYSYLENQLNVGKYTIHGWYGWYEQYYTQVFHFSLHVLPLFLGGQNETFQLFKMFQVYTLNCCIRWYFAQMFT